LLEILFVAQLTESEKREYIKKRGREGERERQREKKERKKEKGKQNARNPRPTSG